jgi:hypothetical protein
MEIKYGFPVVTDNIFKVIDDLGIHPWPKVRPTQDLKEYLAGDLGQTAWEEANRFAPKSEVVFLENPKGGIFRGYRSVGKNWVTVFTLLDGLIPITVEFKHGSEDICLVPPSGVPARKDFESQNPMENCAKREYLEETGIELEKLIPLSNPKGNAVSPRQSTQRYFPYLGIPKLPVIQTDQRLDKNEALKIILVPLGYWLQLIKENQIVDECAITCTFRALQELGRLAMTC